jgi:hypothetical protein
MLYNHRCGLPLWMEWRNVSGGPAFYEQRDPVLERTQVNTCCGTRLPNSPMEWRQASAARELVPVTNNLTVEDSDA